MQSWTVVSGHITQSLLGGLTSEKSTVLLNRRLILFHMRRVRLKTARHKTLPVRFFKIKQ